VFIYILYLEGIKVEKEEEHRGDDGEKELV